MMRWRESEHRPVCERPRIGARNRSNRQNERISSLLFSLIRYIPPTVLRANTASVLSHSDPSFGAQPNSFERLRASESTRLATSCDEYDFPVMPHVYGSRELACRTRPYFSLSINSLIGILSGIGSNWPDSFGGRNTIFPNPRGNIGGNVQNAGN
jgi:hypothetical protein